MEQGAETIIGMVTGNRTDDRETPPGIAVLEWMIEAGAGHAGTSSSV